MSPATFEANPNSENEPWIERPALTGFKFRIWHFMFFCVSAFAVLMILLCCCVKIRVPRTKQEIEADYKRKKIATKFRKRLKIISNQDMEAIDLRKALEMIIEADCKRDQEAEPAVLEITDETEKLVGPIPKQSFGKKVADVIKLGKFAINRNRIINF